MDCTNCGAPLPAKTIRCPYCQTLNDVDLRGRVTVSRGESTRNCPRCKQGMVAVMLGVAGGQTELDQCKSCQGLFFDPGELEGVLDGLEKQAHTVDHLQLMTLIEKETPGDDFEKVAYAPCPDCGKLMNRLGYGQKSGVIVDECRQHGIWLDGGELRRLIRWTQAGGRRHHAQSMAAKREMEAKLAAMPSTVPSADVYSGSTTDSGRRRAGSLFDTADSALDALDLLDGLIRFLR